MPLPTGIKEMSRGCTVCQPRRNRVMPWVSITLRPWARPCTRPLHMGRESPAPSDSKFALANALSFISIASPVVQTKTAAWDVELPKSVCIARAVPSPYSWRFPFVKHVLQIDGIGLIGVVTSQIQRDLFLRATIPGKHPSLVDDFHRDRSARFAA